MSDKKGWGKAVLGWFVVQEDAGGGPNGGAPVGSGMPDGAGGELSADDLIAKYASDDAAPAPPLPPIVELTGPLPPVVEGMVDFEAVYDAAGVDAEERSRVAKALELLGSLPAETPAATKKAIVEAALGAFGVSTELIIEAAVEEMEALESFIRAGQGQTQNTLTEASHRITELDAEVKRLRQAMDDAMAEQRARAAAANAQKLEVQKVLEFFGREAVARVVRESPKLHEPPADG